MKETVRRIGAAALSLVALLVMPGVPAHASLLGVELAPSYRFPDLGTVYPFTTWSESLFTVAAGVETVGDVEGVTDLNVDFDADSVVITFATVLTSPTWNATAFNGVVFTAAVPLGLASAMVDPLTTIAGFDNSRVTFTDSEIRLNWQGLSYVGGSVVAVNFTFGQVPEPGTLALMVAAVAALGASRTRRSAHT